MPIGARFYDLSLSAILVGSVVLLYLCSVSGFQLGLRAKKKLPDPPKPDTSNFVATSMLGLLALILGFTFSLAIARFENRRQLAIDETNAIGTAYLRAQLMRDPEKVRLKSLIRQYLDARISCYETTWSGGSTAPPCKEAQKFQNQIWKSVEIATQTDRGALEGLFVNSLNAMFDLENERNIALQKTLPGIVFWVILLIAGGGLAALQYGRGLRNEHSHGWSMVQIVVLSSVFVMIHDLERPRQGTIRITQDALIQLRERIASE